MSATFLNPSHLGEFTTPTGLFCVGYVPYPSHSWTHRALFCRLRSLTPHTPGEYNTPTGLFCWLGSLTTYTTGKYPHPQGSFVSATLLNPSHSWRVHHTNRALFSRLCYLTPYTPGKNTTPTELFFVGYAP